MKLLSLNWALVVPALVLCACTTLNKPEVVKYDGPVPEVHVIPQPQEVELLDGMFLLNEKTTMYVVEGDPGAAASAQYLGWALRGATGFPLAIVKLESEMIRPNGILLTTHGAEERRLEPEGYQLVVTPETIILRGADEAGLFYGVQTMRQLLPPRIDTDEWQPGPWPMPSVRIVDAPRFPWRGFMLDSSRHFQSKEYILKLLDQMAFYKLNRFHWHLIDNDGWRLEIDQYPELTEIAAWRGEGEHREGGFYTKDDVREVLAHAKKLHIEVIPEIEMPAHVNPVVWTYPELSCSGERWELGTRGRSVYTVGVGMIPYCAGKNETLVFLKNVLDEVVELFPYELIHVGGDERPHGFWSECPHCQARMEEVGIETEYDLQTWFMREMTDYLATKNRRAISWAVAEGDVYDPTEIVDIGNNAIVQNWHGGTHVAAAQGMEVINSNNKYVYFDYMSTGLERIYSFDPVTPRVDGWRTDQILGSEACLWTESVPEARTDTMIFPRLLPFAEIVWTEPERKDLESIRTRVEAHKARLEIRGIDYMGPPE